MGRRAQPPSALEAESSASEAEDGACDVCGELGARVTVACASCARCFHLGCLTPPLRRRPVLAHAWKCADCAAQAEAKASPVGRKRALRGKKAVPVEVEAVVDLVSEGEEEEEEKRPVKKARRAVKKEAKSESENVKKEDKVVRKESDDFMDDAPLSQLRTPSRGKGQAKKPMTKAKGKRPSRAAAKSARQRKSAKDDTDSQDDDDDSDFVGDDDDSVESDDSYVSDASSEPINRRQSKSPAAKHRRGSNSQRASTPKAPAPSRRNNSNSNGNASDADSLDLPAELQAPAESDGNVEEVEDEYDGPSYFIEYAPNARAKCKSCEQKLPSGIIRVGVNIRHSMFGQGKYYKHLECSQLCLIVEVKSEQAEDAGKAADKKMEQIAGMSSLSPKDQELVVAYMSKNTADGVIDERTDITDDQYSKKTRMPEKDPSPLLTATLLPYQREALAWMVNQEASSYRGGILADEMGMGKTIQAISLILESPRADVPPPGVGKVKPAQQSSLVRGGTLVVCPVVAVMQWKSEIERFVEPGHLSVYIHHGAKRDDLPSRIASHDIVLTTYSIIENEVRKTLGWSKVACKYCKKRYLPEKLITHNKYFCGPNAKKTQRQDKQQRKTPRRKLAAGEEEASDEDEFGYPKKPTAKNKAKGPSKSAKKKAIEVSSDDDEPIAKKSKGKSPLHGIHWTRIVLDEAHYIKDRKCNTARGVFELKSDYKWCLTGTPLQNRIGELFSLIRFLQIPSYAYYHCSDCDCQMLDFDFPDRKCPQCPHSSIKHFSFFNKKVVIPIQAYGYVAEGKIAMLRLQNEVLQHILLRRTKEGRADDISLPPKLVRIRKDRLDERENDFYEAIYTQSQAQFNTYVSSGTLLNNYAHIFDLLVRLRQAVDHPYLVIYSKSNPALQLPISAEHDTPMSTVYPATRPVVEQKPLSAVPTEGDDGDGDSPDDAGLCTICHEDVEDLVVSKCGHNFCRECVKEFIESLPVGAAATCPDCSKPLTVELSKSSEVEEWNVSNAVESSKSPKGSQPVVKSVDLSKFHKHSILHRVSDIGSFQTSTKIEALMQELELMRIRDPSGKAIIFSQFVNMLDIIQHRLTLGGVKCVKLSGNMTMDARDRTIRAFREDSSITAFLVSLKAGGVALNLTIASHIFLMDPWWNPAAENQAIDRTHRLGQFKPVQATRFIIAGTVEERILKLQEKKRLIFEGTVGASVSAICRLTEEDLRFLFSR